MRIIGIGGEPGTGKTTLVKNIIRLLSETERPKRFGYKLVRGMVWKQQKVIVVGIYSDDLFAGTDKLSMSVMPHMLEFLQVGAEDPHYQDYSILFEGDRLFCQKLIQYCHAQQKVDCEFFLLCVDKHIQQQRLKKRKTKQNEVWLAGRASKCRNILNSSPIQIVQLKNDAPDNLQENCKLILSKLCKLYAT